MCLVAFVQGVQLKTEPRRTANNGLTFPRIICIMYNEIYHILELVLEMTSFNSQTRLTPDKQIIKYCLNLFSRNCRYCTLDETAAA
jgi:hypothetical protein